MRRSTRLSVTLQAPRKDTRYGASGKAGVRSKRGMRKAPSIDLSQDGRDELRFEYGLEATALRDSEQLGQPISGRLRRLLGHWVVSFRLGGRLPPT